ncbi:MAG: hypothetical protein ACLP8S_16890 [Solirubrobacteraceae bacterium]
MKKRELDLPTTYASQPAANSIAATNGPTSSDNPSARIQYRFFCKAISSAPPTT